MSSQDLSSDEFVSDNSGDLTEDEIFTDDSSSGMSDEEDDSFAQIALEQEGFETPTISSQTFSQSGSTAIRHVPQTFAQHPKLTTVPRTFVPQFTPQAASQAPIPHLKPTTLPPSTHQSAPQSHIPRLKPATFPPAPRVAAPRLKPVTFPPAVQSAAPRLKPVTFPPAAQSAPRVAAPRLKPVTFPPAAQSAPLVAAPRLKPVTFLVTPQAAAPRLKPIAQFPEILTSSGKNIQRIFAPPKLVEIKKVADIIEQDSREEKQRWEYREKYTLRAERILRNISKYYTEEQMFSVFGVSINQINMISRMNSEQIISIGRAKTNILYEKVSYPAEIERTIKILDTIKTS